MVNPVVFGISCVGMDVVLHINILSLIVVPCFFHSSTWVLPQCTFYLHSMWLLYTYILVLLSGVGKALFPNILSQNNWLPRWSWLDDLRVSTFPGFCLRRGIHKVTGVGLGHRVLSVLLVGVHPRFILEVLFVQKLLWDHWFMYQDVFWSIFLVIQAKIFCIHANVSLFDVWYGAVHMEFHCG